MTAGQHDLRSFGRVLHLGDISLDALALLELLSRHQLAQRKNRLDFAKIHIDIAHILTLYKAGNNIIFLVDKSVIDQAAFRFTDTLGNHLLRSLGGNAAEITRRDFLLSDVLQLEMRVDLPGSQE